MDQALYAIPAGGTTSWIEVCRKFGYNRNGCHTDNVVFSKQLTHDLRIEVENVSQNTTTYDKTPLPFFTSVTIYKKELDTTSIYAPKVYERSYTLYYPYGTTFNKVMLVEAATALNGLINKARSLPETWTKRLSEIREAQKRIIELFFEGTTDKQAIRKIMNDVDVCSTFGFSDTTIHPAKSKKDFLPYFDGKPYKGKTTPTADNLTLLDRRQDHTQKLFEKYLELCAESEILYYSSQNAIIASSDSNLFQALILAENQKHKEISFYNKLDHQEALGKTLNPKIQNCALIQLEEIPEQHFLGATALILAKTPQELQSRIKTIVDFHSKNLGMDPTKGLGYWVSDVPAISIELSINNTESRLPNGKYFTNRFEIRNCLDAISHTLSSTSSQSKKERQI